MKGQCGDVASLVALVHGELDAIASSTLRIHLSECLRCAASEQTFARAISLMKSDDAPFPSSFAMRRAVSLFDRTVPPRTSWIERLRAVLVFDSRLQPGFAGIRGASASRQILYNAGDLDVDLQLEMADRQKGWDITGQILETGSASAGAAATVEIDGPGGHLQTSASEFGEFRFDGVAHGQYRLVVRTSAAEVEILDLNT